MLKIALPTALLALAAVHGHAIVGNPLDSYYLDPANFYGLDINAHLGANRFYDLGYTGTRTVAANIEGHVAWNGHETLTHAQNVLTSTNPENAGTRLGGIGWHPTATAHVLGGRPSGNNLGKLYDYDNFAADQGDENVAAAWIYSDPSRDGSAYQRGMAYGSTLWSGGVAQDTDWNTYAWQVTASSLLDPYRTASATGVNGRTADVISGSWGYTFAEVGGSSLYRGFEGSLSALAASSRTTMVFAAMNYGQGTNTVASTAGLDNVISVGATTHGDGDRPYHDRAEWSSGGPVDYVGPDGTVAAARARVDILAPGDNMMLPDVFVPYNDYPDGTYVGTSGAPNAYWHGGAGTSWSAPLVSGGVALLKDVGYDRFGGGDSLDTRVMKAVLLTSADKTTGWDNGQELVGGVISTDQALDYLAGAGRMNLSRAFDQYTSGTTDVAGLGGGTVEELGWDFGEVAEGGQNDYLIGEALDAGGTLNVTLSWFVNDSTTGGLDANGDPQFSKDSFTNLDLQVFRDGTLVAESDARYITTQHLSFGLAEVGNYTLRVKWAGERYDLVGNARERYGLAWSAQPVPEPATLAALGVGALALLRRRKRA